MRAAVAIATCVSVAFFSLAVPADALARRWRDTPLSAPTPTPTDIATTTPTTTPTAPPPSAPPRAPVNATGEYLTRMDANDDGKVSLLEYQDWLSYAFDRMDANRDGTLAPEEQPGGTGAALTREAHRARVAETFKRQDRNRDGALDTRELAAPPQEK